jgi:hypothetical protein
MGDNIKIVLKKKEVQVRIVSLRNLSRWSEMARLSGHCDVPCGAIQEIYT